MNFERRAYSGLGHWQPSTHCVVHIIPIACPHLGAHALPQVVYFLPAACSVVVHVPLGLLHAPFGTDSHVMLAQTLACLQAQ